VPKETDKRDLDEENDEGPRTSIFWAMEACECNPKYRITVVRSKLKMHSFSTAKKALPGSIEIETPFTFENAEPSMNATYRGITNALNEE
jgi:hypothetical protein